MYVLRGKLKRSSGSTKADQNICPRGYMCPVGSAFPLKCPHVCDFRGGMRIGKLSSQQMCLPRWERFQRAIDVSFNRLAPQSDSQCCCCFLLLQQNARFCEGTIPRPRRLTDVQHVPRGFFLSGRQYQRKRQLSTVPSGLLLPGGNETRQTVSVPGRSGGHGNS